MFALVLASPSAALAISVYDVVRMAQKGYTDDQIIALIDATESVFELKAEDLVRLKQLGVGEAVIRRMLQKPPAAGADQPKAEHDSGGGQQPPKPRPPSPAPKEPSHDRPHAQREAGTVDRSPPRVEPRRQPVPAADLSSYAFSEEGAGGHAHIAVALAGVPLLILRDEAGHPSTSRRAEDVVQRLGQALERGQGEFRAAHAGRTDAVVFRGGSNGPELVVLSVSARDARAYQTRSGRSVTTDTLAEYWADLLNDYWDLFVRGTPPRRLAGLHEGEALSALHKAAAEAPPEGGDRLAAAVKRLTREARQHLGRLAAAVPLEFGTTVGAKEEGKP